MAKLRGHIPSAGKMLYKLRKAGYYIGDAVVELVLRDIAE